MQRQTISQMCEYKWLGATTFQSHVLRVRCACLLKLLIYYLQNGQAWCERIGLQQASQTYCQHNACTLNLNMFASMHPAHMESLTDNVHSSCASKRGMSCSRATFLISRSVLSTRQCSVGLMVNSCTITSDGMS